MAEKDREDNPSIGELEGDLKAVEEQVLLYAKDLARAFAERKEKERQLELTQQQRHVLPESLSLGNWQPVLPMR